MKKKNIHGVCWKAPSFGTKKTLLSLKEFQSLQCTSMYSTMFNEKNKNNFLEDHLHVMLDKSFGIFSQRDLSHRANMHVTMICLNLFQKSSFSLTRLDKQLLFLI